MDSAKMHVGGNRSWNCHWSRIFFFLVMLAVPIICLADSHDCDGLLDTPGRTWPNGDIVLEHGEPLRIYCVLKDNLTNPKFRNKRSADLVFFRNDALVESRYISVVNDTAILMHLQKPSPAADTYYCKLNMQSDKGYGLQHQTVCLNYVTIGFKPQEPLNFTCVSHNWEKLICTWDPAPNYIATRYTLTYKLPGQASKKPTLPCPEPPRKAKLSANTCLWDLSTNPPYVQDAEYYIFTLEAENVLGIDSFTYVFNHWAHVIPSKPVNLTVLKKTESAALIEWSAAPPMGNFPPGLKHLVSWEQQGYPPLSYLWTNEVTSDTNYHVFTHILTQLQAPNTAYTARVSMRSALAPADGWWGESSEITFKTSSTLPGASPTTDKGSFEIVSNGDSRDVYLYWQPIPVRWENGDNFTYQVIHIEENGRSVDLLPDEMTKTYAKFTGMSLNSLRFNVVATNCEGSSKENTTLHIPSQLEIPQKPVLFTKVAVDERTIELSWNPMTNSNIVNYTIFQCEDELWSQRPFQCSAYFHWRHIPGNSIAHNVTVPNPEKRYQFAIAVNTPDASSGMVWFSNVTHFNRGDAKLKSVFSNRIEEDRVEIGWTLNPRFNRTSIQGFHIYYCPSSTSNHSTCSAPRMTTTVANPRATSGVVRNLSSSTSYIFIVAVASNNTEILHSDPLYLTTSKPGFRSMWRSFDTLIQTLVQIHLSYTS